MNRIGRRVDFYERKGLFCKIYGADRYLPELTWAETVLGRSIWIGWPRCVWARGAAALIAGDGVPAAAHGWGSPDQAKLGRWGCGSPGVGTAGLRSAENRRRGRAVVAGGARGGGCCSGTPAFRSPWFDSCRCCGYDTRVRAGCGALAARNRAGGASYRRRVAG